MAHSLSCQMRGLSVSKVPGSIPRSGLQGTALRPARLQASPAARRSNLTISAKYSGANVDFSRVEQFKRAPTDVGSPEVQVARLSVRVEQLTAHLKQNRKDYASTRGLLAILAQRKRLLQYLYRTKREAYDKVILEMKIRPLKQKVARGRPGDELSLTAAKN